MLGPESSAVHAGGRARACVSGLPAVGAMSAAARYSGALRFGAPSAGTPAPAACMLSTTTTTARESSGFALRPALLRGWVLDYALRSSGDLHTVKTAGGYSDSTQILTGPIALTRSVRYGQIWLHVCAEKQCEGSLCVPRTYLICPVPC